MEPQPHVAALNPAVITYKQSAPHLFHLPNSHGARPVHLVGSRERLLSSWYAGRTVDIHVAALNPSPTNSARPISSAVGLTERFFFLFITLEPRVE